MQYRTMNDYLSGVFPGRVIKIAVNAGLGCPNRDGTLGRDGCIYCNNLSFNPAYAANDLSGSITAQLAEALSLTAARVIATGIWHISNHIPILTGRPTD